VAGDHGKAGALSEQHAAIAMIGAFTGSSDLPRLTTALGKGLDAGMGVTRSRRYWCRCTPTPASPRSLKAISRRRKEPGTRNRGGGCPSQYAATRWRVKTSP
jgi:4-carboxymuconolactone decarboxylase